MRKKATMKSQSFIDVAVKEGKTVDEVTPFISAVSDIPVTDNKSSRPNSTIGYRPNGVRCG